MTWLVVALLLFADLFWQVKPPMEWTDAELAQFLADSPWAQMSAVPGKAQVGKNAGSTQPIQVYLASARPAGRVLPADVYGAAFILRLPTRTGVAWRQSRKLRAVPAGRGGALPDAAVQSEGPGGRRQARVVTKGRQRPRTERSSVLH